MSSAKSAEDKPVFREEFGFAATHPSDFESIRPPGDVAQDYSQSNVAGGYRGRGSTKEFNCNVVLLVKSNFLHREGELGGVQQRCSSNP